MGRLDDLRGQRIYLDANVFIYAIEGFRPLGDQAQAVLALAEAGGCVLCTSELTLAECLAQPLALGRADLVKQYLLLLQARPALDLAVVDRPALIEAARLRSQTGLKLPDAIHLATARSRACGVLLSNDQHLVGTVPEGMLLADLVV